MDSNNCCTTNVRQTWGGNQTRQIRQIPGHGSNRPKMGSNCWSTAAGDIGDLTMLIDTFIADGEVYMLLQ